MERNTTIATFVMLAWSPVVVALFLRLGRRWATLIAVVGGSLLIPWAAFPIAPGGRVTFGQPEAIGLALALGMVARERGALLRARPRWVDLPAIAYAFYPMVGLLSAGPVAAWDSADMTLHRVTGWLIPYAAARRYFGDVEGARRIAVAVVLATVALVPLCAFEALLGPKWYLGGLVYGIPFREGTVRRLGGWRPEVFFLSGIAVASWLAMAAVVAGWLWLGRSWRPSRGPSWWPTLVLVLASLGCRGVYGYILLACGLLATVLTQTFRTRWVLALVVAAAPTYVALRVSGAWDASSLTRAASGLGREDTVGSRLVAENDVISRVVAKRPLLGFGTSVWHLSEVHEPPLKWWPDGAWLFRLWAGGLIGVALSLTAELAPACMVLGRPAGRPDRAEAGSPAWGLALLLALHAIDGLHNAPNFPVVALAAGSLVGVASTGRGEARNSGRGPARSRKAGPAGRRSTPASPFEVWRGSRPC